MTESEALCFAFERAAGICECIGGGCPSLSHRPGQNRCTTALQAAHSASYFTTQRFANRSQPENIAVVCAACAQSPRRYGQRLPAPGPPAGPDAN